jgi:hypothetical protein
MKNQLPSLLILILIMVSCKNKEEVPAQQTKTDSPEVKNYLPVQDFIKGEVRNVDSFFAGIKMITIRNGKTDSTFISPEEFHRLTAEFETNELSKEYLENHYEESSFLDHSTKAVTFVYSAKEQELPIRRIDLLTAETNGFDKMRSLFIEKRINSGDTTILKRLLWKAGKNFLLVTQKSVGQQQPQVSQVKVVWDNSE